MAKLVVSGTMKGDASELTVVCGRAFADLGRRGLGRAAFDSVVSRRAAPSKRRRGPADEAIQFFVHMPSGNAQVQAFAWGSGTVGEFELMMRPWCRRDEAERALDHFRRWLEEAAEATSYGPFEERH